MSEELKQKKKKKRHKKKGKTLPEPLPGAPVSDARVVDAAAHAELIRYNTAIPIEENGMSAKGLGIPELDLEDFEPGAVDFDEIQDKSGGALTYGFLGLGQGGGRIATAFYNLGYKKTLAVNTAKHDLNPLELPEAQKLWIDYLGDQGAGKDQAKGAMAFSQRAQEVFNALRKVMGEGVDRILVCCGVCGGTGGGSVVDAVELAKKYFDYVGIRGGAERVGVVAALPTVGEVASPTVADNAASVMSELCDGAERGVYAPLVLIDNDKIRKFYARKLTGKEYWPKVNGNVAGLFHVFNLLATKDSAYTSLDPTDYDSIMKQPGCMIMGVTSVADPTEETSVSAAIKRNLEKTLLVEGFELATAKAAGAIVVAPGQMFDKIQGLMDNLEYGFDALASITGNAMIHRGIYRDDSRKKLVVYTLIGGLARPEVRLADLTKRVK